MPIDSRQSTRRRLKAGRRAEMAKDWARQTAKNRVFVGEWSAGFASAPFRLLSSVLVSPSRNCFCLSSHDLSFSPLDCLTISYRRSIHRRR